VGALGRFGWLWAVPVALLVNWALRTDPTLQQWTYYRDFSHYRVALHLQQFFVPLWTVGGTLGGWILGYRRSSRAEAAQASMKEE
jgi:hypothetical protein